MRITWLLDGRLGASGMLWLEDLDHLAEERVTAVLSLTMRNPFRSADLGRIAHLHLPVPDMSRPSPPVLSKAVAFLRESLSDGGRAVVHCGAGLGRTGTVLACFLVASGRTPREAIRAVRDARPGSVETPEQEQAVHDFYTETQEPSDA